MNDLFYLYGSRTCLNYILFFLLKKKMQILMRNDKINHTLKSTDFKSSIEQLYSR